MIFIGKSNIYNYNFHISPKLLNDYNSLHSTKLIELVYAIFSAIKIFLHCVFNTKTILETAAYNQRLVHISQ